MTSFYYPKHRLATVLKQPGGTTVFDAVKAANAAIGALSDKAEAFVDETLATLDAAFAALPPTFDAPALAAIYQLSNNLIGAASTAHLVALDRAAYDLCDLVDRMSARGSCDRQAIKVHIDALHLFRRNDLKGAALDGVAAGLKLVRQRYSAANEAAKPS